MFRFLANLLLPFVQRHADWYGKNEAAKLIGQLTKACSDGLVSNEERLMLQSKAYEWLEKNGYMVK